MFCFQSTLCYLDIYPTSDFSMDFVCTNTPIIYTTSFGHLSHSISHRVLLNLPVFLLTLQPWSHFRHVTIPPLANSVWLQWATVAHQSKISCKIRETCSEMSLVDSTTTWLSASKVPTGTWSSQVILTRAGTIGRTTSHNRSPWINNTILKVNHKRILFLWMHVAIAI